MTDIIDKTNSNKPSYEMAIKQLEDILAQLEHSDIPLEESINQFEQGITLIKHCQSILSVTEQKVKGLLDEQSPNV